VSRIIQSVSPPGQGLPRRPTVAMALAKWVWLNDPSAPLVRPHFRGGPSKIAFPDQQ